MVILTLCMDPVGFSALGIREMSDLQQLRWPGSRLSSSDTHSSVPSLQPSPPLSSPALRCRLPWGLAGGRGRGLTSQDLLCLSVLAGVHQRANARSCWW